MDQTMHPGNGFCRSNLAYWTQVSDKVKEKSVYFITWWKLERFLMFHVDDVLAAGSEKFGKILEKQRTKYQFGRVERSSFVFTGLNLNQDEITIDQTD